MPGTPIIVSFPMEAEELGPFHKERLSLDMPASLHARFKAVCALSHLRMTDELLAFIEPRTHDLEYTVRGTGGRDRQDDGEHAL